MKQLFSNNKNNKNKAFTLIELLVVIAIIGVLSGAVIVAISGAQDSATDSRIKASMDQLRSSIEIYGLVNGANYTGLESDSEISLLIDDIESQVGTPTVNISGSGDRYCLSTNLKSSNELWCIDSAGFAGLGGCINYSCDRSSGYSLGGIPISTGLVGYWTMDEDSLLSPNTIRDYSSYGNTGTIYGATFATDRHGQPNKAMSFDGVDDRVVMSNNVTNMLRYSQTISFWYKIDPPLQNQTMIGGRNFSSNISDGHAIGFPSDGLRIYSDIYSGDPYGKHRSSLIFNYPQDNNWHFVVSSYDSNFNIRSFCIDDICKTTNPNFLNYRIDWGNRDLRIGSNNIGGFYFDGLIDDVRIYNRALSAEEITFLYNSSR